MFDTPDTSELNTHAARARAMARLADTGARTLAATDVDELSSEDLRDLTCSIEQLRRYLDAAESHLWPSSTTVVSPTPGPG